MKNIPIIGKFTSILAVFGVFSLFTSFYAANEMGVIREHYNHAISAPAIGVSNVIQADRLLEDARAKITQLMFDTNAADRQAMLTDIANDKSGFTSALDQVALLNPVHVADVRDLEARGEQLLTSDCSSAIELATSATSATDLQNAQAEFLKTCAPGFNGLVPDMVSESVGFKKYMHVDEAFASNTVDSTIQLSYVFTLGGLALVMIGGFFAIRAWIVTPVKGLQGVMGRLSGGDLQANVIGTERKDEIGGMARAVEVFKEAGIEKLRLETEAAVQRAASEQDRQRTEAERAAAAKQQEFVVHSVATGLEKLSSGDLLFRLTSDFGGDYEKLRGDFNAAMEKLQETMQSIATNTQGVRSGAEEITQASDDLSRRTEQQAASLEETAAALDQITATVRRTAEVANEARDLVATSKTDAERSGDVVRQTVGAMDGIESSSKQIANIIGVIDEIAFQTNLLALNAGVEAARAGDAGRGFAVVATEVRALAQRSADAAKEIKTLISASGQQVETGVKLVSETGNALGRIVTQVTQLNGLVVELAASAKEQATGLGEVNSAVNQMDQVTQQNAAMVEQATAASHGLSSEAQELARLVGQFHIGESAAAPVLKRAAPKAPPKPRTVVTTSANKVAMLPRQDKAPRSTPAGASDDWSEF
jgi:methyl-accepting chemotaxis protein